MRRSHEDWMARAKEAADEAAYWADRARAELRPSGMSAEPFDCGCRLVEITTPGSAAPTYAIDRTSHGELSTVRIEATGLDATYETPSFPRKCSGCHLEDFLDSAGRCQWCAELVTVTREVEGWSAQQDRKIAAMFRPPQQRRVVQFTFSRTRMVVFLLVALVIEAIWFMVFGL